MGAENGLVLSGKWSLLIPSFPILLVRKWKAIFLINGDYLSRFQTAIAVSKVQSYRARKILIPIQLIYRVWSPVLLTIIA